MVTKPGVPSNGRRFLVKTLKSPKKLVRFGRPSDSLNTRNRTQVQTKKGKDETKSGTPMVVSDVHDIGDGEDDCGGLSRINGREGVSGGLGCSHGDDEDECEENKPEHDVEGLNPQAKQVILMKEDTTLDSYFCIVRLVKLPLFCLSLDLSMLSTVVLHCSSSYFIHHLGFIYRSTCLVSNGNKVFISLRHRQY